ncbi:MAG: hypothetical protein OHK0017_08340 [Patescibacteria group bacterium]
MKQVESDSNGWVKMGPGTLYGSISRMIDSGLICQSHTEKNLQPNEERRIYYTLTKLGRATLQAELDRYNKIVRLAGQTGVLSPQSAYES